MSNITVSIGGRNFTLACADGEETHVAKLGQLIDEKVNAAGAVGQSESRMLLFASLMLADEVHELQSRCSVDSMPSGLAERLARIAAKIENLADLLESAAGNA